MDEHEHKRKVGRPAIGFPSNWEYAYDIWKAGKITATEAIALTGLKKNTFYKLAAEYESRLEAQRTLKEMERGKVEAAQTLKNIENGQEEAAQLLEESKKTPGPKLKDIVSAEFSEALNEIDKGCDSLRKKAAEITPIKGLNEPKFSEAEIESIRQLENTIAAQTLFQIRAGISNYLDKVSFELLSNNPERAARLQMVTVDPATEPPTQK